MKINIRASLFAPDENDGAHEPMATFSGTKDVLCDETLEELISDGPAQWEAGGLKLIVEGYSRSNKILKLTGEMKSLGRGHAAELTKLGWVFLPGAAARLTSEPLTFKELDDGAKFIAFPIDGDDSGHGGYRGGAYLFTKLHACEGASGENAMRHNNGMLTTWLPHQQVILVL